MTVATGRVQGLSARVFGEDATNSSLLLNGSSQPEVLRSFELLALLTNHGEHVPV